MPIFVFIVTLLFFLGAIVLGWIVPKIHILSEEDERTVSIIAFISNGFGWLILCIWKMLHP